MNTYLRLWIGIFCFLVFVGSNVFAQDLSTKNNIFNLIKAQMQLVIEENAVLAKQNKILKTELIGLQLEMEKHEQEIQDLDPGFTRRSRLSREQKQVPLNPLPHRLEEVDDEALMKEAQELFLSGQYMDLGEEQSLRELQLYDLQYQKQELELDLQERQNLYQEGGKQRRRELEAAQKATAKSVKEEASMRRKVAEVEKRVASYSQNIDLLKTENKKLKRRIDWVKKQRSQ